jgi:putative membrane protein
MKMNPRLFLLSLLLASVGPLAAADAPPPAATWHAQSLAQAVLIMLLFVAIGIAAAIVGYKLFDKCTPGNLSREIIENKNLAAAVVAAAVILGVCIIVAAAMLG